MRECVSLKREERERERERERESKMKAEIKKHEGWGRKR